MRKRHAPLSNPSPSPDSVPISRPISRLKAALSLAVATLLGGILAKQLPEGNDRAITDLTTTVNNICGKALTEGEIYSLEGTDGSMSFQLNSKPEKILGDGYGDVCICDVATDLSSITCTGARNFNEKNTLSMEDPFTVSVDSAGRLSMYDGSTLEAAIALLNGDDDAATKMLEDQLDSELKIDDQESDAAKSARRMMALYAQYIYKEYSTIPVMVDPSTGQLVIPDGNATPPDSNDGNPFQFNNPNLPL